MRRLAAVAAVAALAAGCTSSSPRHAAKPASDSLALHGATDTSSRPRPEFVLVDTSGRRYDFTAQTHGRVTLLYFGYTHCPDQCPTAMADVATALRSVPPTVAQQVQVVFVTTDPWRDTRPVLRHWLDHFHPPQPYVGLTGTPAQLAGAEVTMGMPVSTREAVPKSYRSGKYAVSHFAAVMAFGRDDRLATLYPSGVAPSDIATDLKALVKG